jgi:3'-phosphoadenosine 5'-phosphosulfate sulfotransferase (PAPS reductase)/FAD synthetase
VFKLELQKPEPEIPIATRVLIADQRLARAVERFSPIGVWGLFSGGHDSLSACFIASRHPLFKGVIHANTGIGVEATREFVRRTCAEQRWPLLEYKAIENTNRFNKPDPMDYRAMVLRWGFPGPAGHGIMYTRLKLRALLRHEREHKASSRKSNPRFVMYVSGQRSAESTRRMGHMSRDPEISTEERRIWVAPIHDWSKSHTAELIEFAGLERNFIVDLLHKSGECLCGAFAEKGELAELQMWKETRPAHDYIVRLQKEVIAAGHPWGWEDRPPEHIGEEKKGQMIIEPMRQFMCWNCNRNSDDRKKNPQRAKTSG